MSEKFICDSAAVVSGGNGFNFYVDQSGVVSSAFLIRHNEIAYAYLNRCAHLSLELDWERGEFFDASGEYLICANHGAMYEPDTGKCINGPCYGASLIQIPVVEINGQVLLENEDLKVVDSPG